jgi:uncharacterized protein (PEP-CTERM system associated)
MGAGAAWSQVDATPPAPAASGATMPEPAASQPVNLPPRLSLEARAAATNNGGVDDNGMRRADFITSLRPVLDVTHKGAGFNADVHAAATLIDYARSTQPDGVLPDLHGQFDATFLDRWLRFDGAAYLRAAESDPFGVRTDDLTAANRHNDWGAVAGGALQHDLGREVSFLARESFGVTRSSGVTGGVAGADAATETRLNTNATVVRLERKPTPLGASVEVNRLDNRVSSDQGGSRYTLTTGRLRGTMLVGGGADVSVLVGQDRSDYLLSSHVDPLYGAALAWTPGPRTHLDLEVEHRYFGESGLFRLEHRTPFLVVSIGVRREPVDATSSFGSIAQGSDVRSALDAILTTRYPDPATRLGVVDSIVSSRGLATATSGGAVNLLGDYPQLQTAAEGALTLLGVRDTLSLSAYALTTRVLTRNGDPLSGLAPATADSRQRGAALQLEHRLGAQLSAMLSGNWSRIEALGGSTERSSELTWRLTLLDHLSRRSDLTLGLQWNRFETTAVGQRSFDATLGLVGLIHRF